MLDSPRKGKRFAWLAMYYLPLPWALDLTVVLIPFPSSEGWSLLYHQFPSRSNWITYGALLGAFIVFPWIIRKRIVRVVSKNWWDFFVSVFWGYAIAIAATLTSLLLLGACGLLGTPLDGENMEFAILTLLYVPPPWAPVIGAILQVRRPSEQCARNDR